MLGQTSVAGGWERGQCMYSNLCCLVSQVDKQALDIQMLEKKKQEDEENQNSMAYGE